MKRSQLSTLNSLLKNKGAALREILRFHAVGGEIGQVSASEKGFVLSRSALSSQVSQKKTKENFHDRGLWQRVEF